MCRPLRTHSHNPTIAKGYRHEKFCTLPPMRWAEHGTDRTPDGFRRCCGILLTASVAAVLVACNAGSPSERASSPTTEAPRTQASIILTPPPELTPFIDPARLPRAITAVMLRHVTYEEDEPLEEAESGGSQVAAELMQAAADDGLRTTSETTRLGEFAGESLLRPGDPQYRNRLGYRSEWQSKFHAERDTEYWYSASFYLPEDWDQGKNRSFNDRIILQFHEGTGGSPVFSLHLDDDSSFFVRRKRADDSFQYLWSAPFQTERWYDFVFQAKWTDDDDGYFRIYFNQRLVSEYEGRTLADGSTVYTKWGIYGQPTHVLFDEVRIVEGEDGLRLASPWPMALR